MAYGQYGGYVPQNGYQHTYYGQPMQDRLAMLRSMQQQMPQTDQDEQIPESSILWVQGKAGVDGFFVAPGCEVLLMDSECDRFYIKSVDKKTKKPNTRTFDFVERFPEKNKMQPGQQRVHEDYVTRAEFEALVARIESRTSKEESKANPNVKEEAQNGEPVV